MLSQQELKQQAADAALQYIIPMLTPDAVIGVGTGSTADLFIDGLAKLKGRFRAAVASSERSAKRLTDAGIVVLDLNQVQSMPVYVDGADEIDPAFNLIKGGGGALTREKIVAEASEQFLCIADESKLVPGNRLKIDFDVESREYNGRWYTDVKAWRVDVDGEGGSAASGPIDTPHSDDDGLPF